MAVGAGAGVSRADVCLLLLPGSEIPQQRLKLAGLGCRESPLREAGTEHFQGIPEPDQCRAASPRAGQLHKSLLQLPLLSCRQRQHRHIPPSLWRAVKNVWNSCSPGSRVQQQCLDTLGVSLARLDGLRAGGQLQELAKGPGLGSSWPQGMAGKLPSSPRSPQQE